MSPIAPPQPSSLTTHILTSTSSKPLTHAPHLHHLAAQILHNLQYQHDWHSLSTHTHILSSSPSRKKAFTSHLLPRPLITGIPPSRVYTHPDLQRDLVLKGLKEEDLPEERVWVLPSHLREKWSLRMFGEVFDVLPEVAPGGDEDVGEEVGVGGETENEGKGRSGEKRSWDKEKNMLLATVEDDSTVVYYIVHDGLVKPRQN